MGLDSTHCITTDKFHNSSDKLASSTEENQDTDHDVGSCDIFCIDSVHRDQEDASNMSDKFDRLFKS
jgi:hypothetical protein